MAVAAELTTLSLIKELKKELAIQQTAAFTQGPRLAEDDCYFTPVCMDSKLLEASISLSLQLKQGEIIHERDCFSHRWSSPDLFLTPQVHSDGNANNQLRINMEENK